ncbi:MAG: glycosyltransferase family 4 protein [Patescibacteria group bacterium]
MRILITTGIFKPEPGGPATYTVELARRLSSAGHTVRVITYSDQSEYVFDKEFQFHLTRVVRRKNKLLNYIAYFSAVFKEARAYNFIYSMDWFSAGVPVMFVSWLTRKKYAVRVGGGYIWEKYLSEGRPPMTLKKFYEDRLYKEYKVLYFFIKRVLKSASFVVFNSDQQRELYQKHYGLKPEKITTINNPVPENRFANLVQTYKTSYADRDKEIVFVGRFIRMKNIDSALKAFALLKDKSFVFTLIGSGPIENELRELVRSLHLESRVQFLPTMGQADLYRRIANCYYVILPSWTDISPNQIYECMSLGIPFLLTKEHYLKLNKNDFLKVDPASVDDIAEKMNKLTIPHEYERFVASLSELHVDNTWNHVLVEHLRLYKKYF